MSSKEKKAEEFPVFIICVAKSENHYKSNFNKHFRANNQKERKILTHLRPKFEIRLVKLLKKRSYRKIFK